MLPVQTPSCVLPYALMDWPHCLLVSSRNVMRTESSYRTSCEEVLDQAGFEVLRVLITKSSIFWDIMFSSSFESQPTCFGGICSLHLQGRRISQAKKPSLLGTCFHANTLAIFVEEHNVRSFLQSPVSSTLFFYYYWWDGTKSLGTAATSGLLYKPQMIDEGDYGAIGGMKIGRENRSTRRKPAPAPLCPPQIPHDLTRARTRAAAVGSRWLTAWGMALSIYLSIYVYLSMALKPFARPWSLFQFLDLLHTR
jgi:hypothetical protein